MSIPLNLASIVVPLTNEADLRKISDSSGPAPWDIVEIRIDHFPVTPELCMEIACASPVILTCRHPDEGGNGDLQSDAERSALLAPLIPHAAAIDIEIAHAAQMAETIKIARQSNLTLILSAHDFLSTPTTEKLEQIVKSGIANHADLIKVATTTDTPEQLCRLLSLFTAFPNQCLSLMGMGKLGMASRLITAQSGSLLNYAALNEGNAPGQWPVEEFRDLLSRHGTID